MRRGCPSPKKRSSACFVSRHKLLIAPMLPHTFFEMVPLVVILEASVFDFGSPAPESGALFLSSTTLKFF